MFTPDTAEQVLTSIKANSSVAVGGYVSTLGGVDRASILLTVALEPKEKWFCGILENSNYSKFHLHQDGSCEQLTRGQYTPKVRKTYLKTAEDFERKIVGKLKA